jgi:hypothetical protein
MVMSFGVPLWGGMAAGGGSAGPPIPYAGSDIAKHGAGLPWLSAGGREDSVRRGRAAALQADQGAPADAFRTDLDAGLHRG